MLPSAGVPAIVAVPSPLSVNPTPEGRSPVDARAGAGVPVVVTVKEPTCPTEKVVLLALVTAGGCPMTAVMTTSAASLAVLTLTAVAPLGT